MSLKTSNDGAPVSLNIAEQGLKGKCITDQLKEINRKNQIMISIDNDSKHIYR